MGFTAVVFAVAGLASLGLPGLSGFVAELLVFLGLFQTYPALGVLGIIGAGITAVYILRLLSKVFFGPADSQWPDQTDASSSLEEGRKEQIDPSGPLGERWKDLTDASGLERVSTGILAALLVLVGLFPFPFMRVISSGVLDLLAMMDLG